jgi:2,3-bisphosphoglycerate-independent phosphoglycerate mutase
MSAYEVTAAFEEMMAAEPSDFVVLNFANPDMVGHTGDVSAAIEAVEHVDRCLARVLAVLAGVGAQVIVTSDHGNAEEMLERDGEVNTSHSMGRVPLIVCDQHLTLRDGAGLADVAPTLLGFMGLAVPPEMTGRAL